VTYDGIDVALSIGVCELAGADLETMLRRADQALYAAKARGRDHVCRHTATG
jgi:PleD family two-component response regulator